MVDVDKYLKKLDEIGSTSSQKNRQARNEFEFQQREKERKYAFRRARKVFRERDVKGTDGKKIKGYISQSDSYLGNYFLGTEPRRYLGAKNVERLFGKEYAQKHFGHFYTEHSSWNDNDEDAKKRVSDEEIGANRALVQSLAYNLLENGNIDAAIRGANLYAKIGKGKKAIPRLVEKVEETAEKSPHMLTDRKIRYVKLFIKKHGRERQPSPSGIEGRTAVFAFSTLAGIALSVSSFNLTGNAIADVTGTGQGLLGAFLFVFGLFGLFFNISKN